MLLAATDGALRLVSGTTSLSGRLEIFHNGVWGTICDDQFDDNDGIVACRSMGYRSAL